MAVTWRRKWPQDRNGARRHPHAHILRRQHIAAVGPGIPLGLAVLAIAQMEVHLVFFLHITTGPDNTKSRLVCSS
jgi:hypothetical protein